MPRISRTSTPCYHYVSRVLSRRRATKSVYASSRPAQGENQQVFTSPLVMNPCQHPASTLGVSVRSGNSPETCQICSSPVCFVPSASCVRTRILPPHCPHGQSITRTPDFHFGSRSVILIIHLLQPCPRHHGDGAKPPCRSQGNATQSRCAPACTQLAPAPACTSFNALIAPRRPR